MAVFTARQSATCFWSLPSSAWRQTCLPVMGRSECRRLPNRVALPYPCQISLQRRSASSFGGGQPYRNDSTGRTGVWTTGRVSLLVAVTGLFTYLYGVQQPSIHARAGTFIPQGARKPRYGTKKDMENAIEEISQVLGPDAISRDEDDLHSHGFSDMSSINIDRFPTAVVYPASTKDVSAIAKVCHKYKVPMIPFSGGTSLEGNFASPFGGISIDFTHMDQIVELHADDLDVVVQPSVPWMTLNDKIKKEGLFFPIDPGPSARIGGMVGTNCSGTNAVRYGTMKDWVINLTVVLADGTIIKTRKRPRKSSAGYNLTNLFVGSEGTLGLVTEITLKLTVIPQETSVAVVTFPTIRDAAHVAGKIMRTGVPVAAMEVMDEVQMRVINQTGVTGRKWKESPTMFFKFSGTSGGVAENIALVKSIAKTNRCGEFIFAVDETEQRALWSARKEALWSMLALRDEKAGGEVWSTDVCVPLSRLPDLMEVSKIELDSLGVFASILGHIGDGNFHSSLLYDARDPKQRAAVAKCVHDMVERALEMEGTCTGEHGIGLGKKDSLLQELGIDTIEVMKSIKGALDPYWLMNPGKIIDP